MIEHYFTNENVEAIVQSLDIRPNDTIRSICGSGAQGFAMLEYLTGDGKIDICDRNADQMNYAQNILKMIVDKDYCGLIGVNMAPRNNGYFKYPARLEKIAQNHLKASFINGDIIPFNDPKKYSKVYLSNARIKPSSVKDIVEKGGLVYMTKFPWCFYDNNVRLQTVDEKDIEGIFVIEKEKTKLAQDLEDSASMSIVHSKLYNGPKTPKWNPVVLRRI